MLDSDGLPLRDFRVVISGKKDDPEVSPEVAELVVKNCSLVGMAALWLWHRQKDAVASGKPLDTGPLVELLAGPEPARR